MNGRVYDPALGRFLSVDPVFQFPTNTQSLNPYTYVLNSPLSFTDPTGLMCETGDGEEMTCAMKTAGGTSASSVTVNGQGVGPGSKQGTTKDSKPSEKPSTPTNPTQQKPKTDEPKPENGATGKPTNSGSDTKNPQDIESAATRKLEDRAMKQLTELPVDGEIVERNRDVGQGDGHYDPDGKLNLRSGEKHDGIDVAAEEGTSVKAAADGVARVRVNSDTNENGVLGDDGYGYYVEVTHADGIVTRYAHLQQDMEAGSKFMVKAGDEVGKVGRTGNVPDGGQSHVHLEVLVDNRRVDPQRIYGY